MAKLKTKEYNLTPFSWDSFVTAFKEAFGDPDPAGTAQFKMEMLKQGTQTADEYVASFNELKADTGFNDVALDRFQKGLNQALVDKIYNLPEMPSTLSGWIHWATKLDRQWRQREARKKMTASSTSQKTSPASQKPNKSPPFTQTISVPSASAVNQQPDAIPMEIDSGWKKVRPLICFKCRKPGHMARQCPSTVNINSMDYDSLKAFMKEEIAKEKTAKEELAKKETITKKEDF